MLGMSQPSNLPEAELTVGAVARRLGVAPATLRTWGHRYGLGPSEHTAGKHRRYTAEDVARLDVLRQLMLNGVTVSEAAKVVSQADVAVLPTFITNVQEVLAQRDFESQDSDVISLDGVKAKIRSLSRAAQMLDQGACERIIAEVISAKGVTWAWEQVIVPVLIQAGEHWEKTGEGVEVEHLLSEALTAQFKRIAGAIEDPINTRPVILACAPFEMHSLPIYAIAAGLAEHRIASRVLGPRMPAESLAVACNRIGPSAVVIWAHTIGTADARIWDSLRNQRPAPVKVSAGPGWGNDLPADVATPKTFTDTLIDLAAAAGHM